MNDNDRNQSSFEEEEGGMDLSAASDLEGELVSEPWIISAGRSFGRFLAKIGVGILGFLFDAIKAVFGLVFGIFYGLYALVRGAFVGLRGAHRNFYEVDVYGKVSYFVMGVSHIKSRHIAEGVIYLAVEIVFLLWMGLTGWISIGNLSLNDEVKESFKNVGNILVLVQGIFTLIFALAFFVFYFSYLRAVHDLYVIHNEPAFKNAQLKALYAIEHNADFEDVKAARTGHERRKLLMENHGYGVIDARYASYLPWSRLDPNPQGLVGAFVNLRRTLVVFETKVYEKYDALRRQVELRLLSDVFARFLEWHFVPSKETRGYSAVYQEARTRYIRFIHKYDKYNDYHAVTRDYRVMITLLSSPKTIADCAHGIGEGKTLVGPDAALVYALRDPSKYLAAAFDGLEGKITHKAIDDNLNVKVAMDGSLRRKLSKIFHACYLYAGQEKAGGEPLVDGKINKEALKGRPIEENLKTYLAYYEQRCEAYGVKYAAKAATSVPIIASRLIGVYGCSYSLAKKAARIYLRGLKAEEKPAKENGRSLFYNNYVNPFALAGRSMNEVVGLYRRSYELRAAAFEEENAARAASAKAVSAILADPYAYLSFEGNENAVLKALGTEHPELTAYDLRFLRKDLAMAARLGAEGGAAYLKARHQESLAYARMSEAPFHGQANPFVKKVKQFGDERFAFTVMSLPIIGSICCSIVPLVISILIAFTDWAGQAAGQRLFTWSLSGWENAFGLGATGQVFFSTFLELLTWTLVWAVLATFLNYIFGIILALMINRKSIKLKKMWRTIFVVTIAIPQFITLLCMRSIFSDNGPINTWLLQQGWYVDGVSKALGMGRYVGDDWIATAFPFLVTKTGSASRADLPYTGTNPFVLAFTQAFWPKLTIVLINIWVGIPYTMLSTSGILMNIPDDLYESSQIDGANKWRQFWSITMPYVLFVTGPSLLTTFIGNINNFNVIFFLTDGGYNHGGMLETSAGDTSLLITWIYNLSNATPPMYNTTSILGCIVFAICGFFSLIVYRRLGSVKNEEEFQ